MVNNVTQRLVYENARAAVMRAFGQNYNEASIRMTQSYLRLEQAIQQGKTQYNFPVQVNQGSVFNTEKRLNLQDTFVISEVGIYLAKPSGPTDAAFKLNTFADPQVFTTAGAAAAMEVIYNSELQILVDNVQYVPGWDLQKHKVVPQTQEGSSAPPTTEYFGNSYGMYPMEPNLLLVGSKNNVVNIVLPAGIATIEPNSRIIIKLNGLLVQNSTTVR